MMTAWLLNTKPAGLVFWFSI